MEIFAERIKALRKQKKISQQKMAELIGIDVRLYQYYESNEKCPSLSNALNIAVALSVSLDYLCGLTEKSEINS